MTSQSSVSTVTEQKQEQAAADAEALLMVWDLLLTHARFTEVFRFLLWFQSSLRLFDVGKLQSDQSDLLKDP